MKIWRITTILFSLCLICTLSPIRAAAAPAAPLRVELSARSHPEVSLPFSLRFSVTTLIDAPRMRVMIVIPEGVTIVTGATEQILSMSAGETRIFDLKLMFQQAGVFQFIAGASIEVDAETRLSANTDLLIEIGSGQTPSRQFQKSKKRFKTKEGEAVME